MNFIGKALRLDDVDLPRIGAMIGVGEDEIHAFMDVESAGSGFDATGRPKMLFEPHIFWRELGKGPKRTKAVRLGLAYAKWKPRGYPKDSYPRLQAAMAIDEDAALRSASWGLCQIMGFNHEAVGYRSAKDMVLAFMADEENHVKAMVAFLVNRRIDDDLRAHNWQKIEDVYNGGGFGGAYARKMAKAFAKWQKIKDTPYTPVSAEPPRPVTAPKQPEAPVSPPEPPPAPVSRKPSDIPVLQPFPDAPKPSKEPGAAVPGGLIAGAGVLAGGVAKSLGLTPQQLGLVLALGLGVGLVLAWVWFRRK